MSYHHPSYPAGYPAGPQDQQDAYNTNMVPYQYHTHLPQLPHLLQPYPPQHQPQQYTQQYTQQPYTPQPIPQYAPQQAIQYPPQPPQYTLPPPQQFLPQSLQLPNPNNPHQTNIPDPITIKLIEVVKRTLNRLEQLVTDAQSHRNIEIYFNHLDHKWLIAFFQENPDLNAQLEQIKRRHMVNKLNCLDLGESTQPRPASTQPQPPITKNTASVPAHLRKHTALPIQSSRTQVPATPRPSPLQVSQTKTPTTLTTYDSALPTTQSSLEQAPTGDYTSHNSQTPCIITAEDVERLFKRFKG